MQVVHSVELGVPTGALYSLDMNLCRFYVMYSVKVQMQSHGDGCQVIIGRCFSRSGLSGGSGNCLGLCCLGSLNRTAYNCTQQFKNEDKDNQQSNDHAESQSGNHPDM